MQSSNRGARTFMMVWLAFATLVPSMIIGTKLHWTWDPSTLREMAKLFSMPLMGLAVFALVHHFEKHNLEELTALVLRETAAQPVPAAYG